MNAVSTAIESDLLDVSAEPLGELIESAEGQLRIALQRIRDEATSGDPSAAVAAFNSSL